MEDPYQSDCGTTHCALCMADDVEDVRSISPEEFFADPYRNAKIRVSRNGRFFKGHVEDIHRGLKTLELLYLVRYDDGDLEYFTLDELQAAVVKDVPLTISVVKDMSILRWRISATNLAGLEVCAFDMHLDSCTNDLLSELMKNLGELDAGHRYRFIDANGQVIEWNKRSFRNLQNLSDPDGMGSGTYFENGLAPVFDESSIFYTAPGSEFRLFNSESRDQSSSVGVPDSPAQHECKQQ